MTTITYLIMILLIFIAIYSGLELILGSISTENALGQIQWFLCLAILTGSLGFLGLLIQSIQRLLTNKNNAVDNNDEKISK